jgi:hypothetical protein
MHLLWIIAKNIIIEEGNVSNTSINTEGYKYLRKYFSILNTLGR